MRRSGLDDPFEQERVNEARRSLPSASQHVRLTEPRAYHPAGGRECTASPSGWPSGTSSVFPIIAFAAHILLFGLPIPVFFYM